jgi:circadian clock protein KaiC
VPAPLSAIERGEKAAYYLFDEGLSTLLVARALYGHGPAAASSTAAQLRPGADRSGRTVAGRVRQLDPPRRSRPTARKVIVIDSLNAYLQAMPGEKYLMLQMHEMLSYLNQQGVITLLILGQHGIIGDVQSDIDLSYLSDTIMLYRYFEARGTCSRRCRSPRAARRPTRPASANSVCGRSGLRDRRAAEGLRGRADRRAGLSRRDASALGRPAAGEV